MEKMVTVKPMDAYRQTLERRIQVCMQNAVANLLEVGNCLAEAKENGVVPHGQWEQWVREQTGFSERQAQRLMQAARSVEPGSALSRLGMSKIQMILALPEGERDAVAEQAEAENLTVKQLRARIDELQGKVKSGREEINSLGAERNQLRDKLEHTRRDLDMMAKYSAGQDKLVDEMDERIVALTEERDALLRAPAEGISAEAQREIDRLKEELARAEDYAEEQSELRQQIQQEMLNNMEGAEPRYAAYGFDPVDLIPVARTFLGQVSALPHMRLELARLLPEDRAQVSGVVETVAAWVESMRQTLDVMVVEGGAIHG